MNRSPQRSARATALTVLRQYTAHRGDAAELLGPLLGTTDRSGQATDLVYGVIRNAVLLDRLLTGCADVRKNNVKPAVWTILRLGVFELVFAPKTAAYAIVNEAVNLASAVSSHKSGGFVNAVLRNVQRKIADRDGDANTASPTHTVPRPDGRACVFVEEVLPDPANFPEEYLHYAWSLPQWLVHRWSAEYGQETAAEICRASNRHPSVYAWPNTQHISAEALAETLTAEGVNCRLWAERGAVQLCKPGAVNSLDAFKNGLFYIQDPTAEALASFLDLQPGQTLVDVCAAPGGKTIALALRLKDTGCILASDSSAERLARVDENTHRLNLSCVRSVSADKLAAYVQTLDRVDAVILDVPCSNTGVLARRVEARRRLERGLEKAVLQLQQSLLETAFTLLKPGAKLVYSTCSILPEENEQQIQCYLEKHPEFTLINQKKTLPSIEKTGFFDHDGGFLALLAGPSS
ncbi:MAG: hypothetical protein GXY41_05485 [Phycisphaerae bacterium]|nr:hypothetical protein [Phycisphaerae bacterium]